MPRDAVTPGPRLPIRGEQPKVVETPLDALKPWDENPRRIGRDELDQLKRMLVADPGMLWPRPLIALPDGRVIAGNMRLRAARELGWSRIPVFVADLDEDTARLWALRDNNPLGDYVEDDLGRMLAGLAERNVQVELAGFTSARVDELLAGVGAPASTPRPEPDDAPPLPEEATSKAGVVYQLGRHRLLCGDATDLAAVTELLAGVKPPLVFTDPPYNADYSRRVDKARRKPWGGIQGDNLPPDEYEQLLDRALANVAQVTVQGASLYVFTDWKSYPILAGLFRARFTQKTAIVWDKQHFGLGRFYRTQHELLVFGTVGDRPTVWNAGRDERDVWSLNRDSVTDYRHPTQKPCELGERAMRNSSRHGDAVLDLFGGSGSTLIAAERTGRTAYVLELDPRYCDVIRQRYESQAA